MSTRRDLQSGSLFYIDNIQGTLIEDIIKK